MSVWQLMVFSISVGIFSALLIAVFSANIRMQGRDAISAITVNYTLPLRTGGLSWWVYWFLPPIIAINLDVGAGLLLIVSSFLGLVVSNKLLRLPVR